MIFISQYQCVVLVYYHVFISLIKKVTQTTGESAHPSSKSQALPKHLETARILVNKEVYQRSRRLILSQAELKIL